MYMKHFRRIFHRFKLLTSLKRFPTVYGIVDTVLAVKHTEFSTLCIHHTGGKSYLPYVYIIQEVRVLYPMYIIQEVQLITSKCGVYLILIIVDLIGILFYYSIIWHGHPVINELEKHISGVSDTINKQIYTTNVSQDTV